VGSGKWGEAFTDFPLLEASSLVPFACGSSGGDGSGSSNNNNSSSRRRRCIDAGSREYNCYSGIC